MPKPNWIAVDWGTSNLRAWSMQDTTMVQRAESAQGMSTLSQDEFAPALVALTQGFGLPKGAPVVACGMVGSRQGWAEAPYRAVPCTPLASGFATTQTDDNPVYIIAGLQQDNPPDVMRGEETQIAGFLARNPGWDGVICLPGTHTKWAEISAGEIISFQTFMSGELFALLSNASVLRHSVASQDWDADAFLSAVDDAISKPERLAARLFSIRASDLLRATAPATARAGLSGLLIGSELAAARPYWLGREIALIGGAAQTKLYGAALSAQGAPVTQTDAETMTLTGLVAAHLLLQEQP